MNDEKFLEINVGKYTLRWNGTSWAVGYLWKRADGRIEIREARYYVSLSIALKRFIDYYLGRSGLSVEIEAIEQLDHKISELREHIDSSISQLKASLLEDLDRETISKLAR